MPSEPISTISMTFHILMSNENRIMFIILLTVLFNIAAAVDYCGLCENGTHTMCKYRGPAADCPGYRQIQLSTGEKKYIVDIHNDIRNHVASGLETRGTLGNQPSAADMFMLEWDNELADIAQRWADQCIRVNETMQHDICKRTERFAVGQNILTAITNEPELPDFSVLIFNWYQQVANIIPSDLDIFLGVKKGKYLIGQYTQLVWSETRYVGCGLITFRESRQYQHRLVCNYGPAGNVIGEAVYQRGIPCSRCPTRKCDPVRKSLCQGSDSENPNTKSDVETEDIFQSSIALFSSNISQFITNKINVMCINPDDSNKVTKCIADTDSSNITSDYAKDNLKYITFDALSSENTGLPKADQKTLNHLIALWKKLKLKGFTDILDATKTEKSDKKDIELNETDGISKNVTYITTVIPSIVIKPSMLEKALNRNTTVFYSSQELQKFSMIDNDVEVFDMTQDNGEGKPVLDYLDNVHILPDSGEKHFRNAKRGQAKAHQSYFKLKEDYGDVSTADLPTSGGFRRERGSWLDGHCKCEEMPRSSSNMLKFTVLPTLITLLIINILSSIS